MKRWCRRFTAVMILTTAAGPARSQTVVRNGAALAVVDTAIARMGGPALRDVRRVRLEMLTQWQRTGFDDRPGQDRPSYERHTELRDYSIPAWRNTRQFGSRTAVDVVRDSVAIRDFGEGFAPLSAAYVDERREHFAYSPDRLVLELAGATDLRTVGDTVMSGLRHARVRATLDGRPTTVYFRRGDGLPTLVRFRAAQPLDYGLAPWGEMDVEVWYASWRAFPGGVMLPTQWDVWRVGRPYKRMSVLSADLDAVAPADSFAVSDSLRRAFFRTENRAMHDVPVDSITRPSPGLLQFHGIGAPRGAVRVGGSWLLLETGQAPLNLDRALTALAAEDPAPVAGALVAPVRTGNGGVAGLAAHGIPAYVGPGAEPFAYAILRGHHVSWAGVSPVADGRWLRVGADSVRLEPVDLPDAPGALLAWVPSLRWLYAPDVMSPLDEALVLAHARRRGWAVASMGTARGLSVPPVEPDGGGSP